MNGAVKFVSMGAKLASDNAALTLTGVLPLLNQWIDTGSSFVVGQMK